VRPATSLPLPTIALAFEGAVVLSGGLLVGVVFSHLTAVVTAEMKKELSQSYLLEV
jgi:hypothetical protein